MGSRMRGVVIGVATVVVLMAGAAAVGMCPPDGPWPIPPWCEPDGQRALPALPALPTDRSDDSTPTPGEPVQVHAEIVTPESTSTVELITDDQVWRLERQSPITVEGLVTLSYGQSYTLRMDGVERDGVFEGGYAAFLDEGRRTGVYPGVHFDLEFPPELVEADDLMFDYVQLTGTGRPLIKGFYLGSSGSAPVMADDEFFEHARRELPIMLEAGAGWVNIVPVWFFFPYEDGTHRTTSELRPMYHDEFYAQRNTGYIYPTFDDDELRDFIRHARSLGLKVYLAPHITPAEYGPESVAGKSFLIVDDLDEFFGNYRRMIAHYADIAQETGVELLGVGVENDSLTINDQGVYPGVDLNNHWYEVIDVARDRFDGALTYSAAAGDLNYSAPNEVEFWDALDYIGFEWYLPLTDQLDISLPELVELAQAAIEDLARPLHERYDKPLLFTEIGFEAKPYAWTRSYEGSHVGEEFDRLAAALSYEYVFQAIADVDFIEGMFVWSWQPTADTSQRFPIDMWWSIANPGNGVQHHIVLPQLAKWYTHHATR